MVSKILGGGGVQMGVGSCSCGENLILQLEWLVLGVVVRPTGISTRFGPFFGILLSIVSRELTGNVIAGWIVLIRAFCTLEIST